MQVHPNTKMITAATKIAMTLFWRVSTVALHVLSQGNSAVVCEVDETGHDACIDECEQALLL